MTVDPFTASAPSLGFGLMRLPHLRDDRHLPIDGERVTMMVDRFIEGGGTYFDTAYVYGNGDSERCIREALVKRFERDSFQLADKLPCWHASSYNELSTLFDTSCRRCGVDYFDVYLVHSLTAKNYEHACNIDAWRLMSNLKEQGRAKRIGFSFHDSPELLDRILEEHPEVDVVQLQLNYIDWDDPGIQAGKNYDIVRKHGKQIIAMEPIKGGGLADMDPRITDILKDAEPEVSPASWALRFVGDLEDVPLVLSGMGSLEQMDDNLATFSDMKELSLEELDLLDEVKKRLRERPTIPCTACHYCTKGCPNNIDIPEFLRILNQYNIYSSKVQCQHEYNNTLGHGGLPKDCIECNQCEDICPQHLKVTEYLKQVDQLFG